MPYNRRNTRGRGLTKKQRVEVKKLVVAPMERKAFHAAYQDTTISDTHLVSEISNIGQGDTIETRDGNQIKITSCFIGGNVVAGDSTNIVRLTLIRWKPNSTPTADLIYEQTAIGSGGAMFSDFNHDYRSDFVVLKDKFITVESSNGQLQKMFTLRAGKQPKTTYNDSATSGANKLFLIACSDSLAASHPTVTFWCDIKYIDG